MDDKLQNLVGEDEGPPEQVRENSSVAHEQQKQVDLAYPEEKHRSKEKLRDRRIEEKENVKPLGKGGKNEENIHMQGDLERRPRHVADGYQRENSEGDVRRAHRRKKKHRHRHHDHIQPRDEAHMEQNDDKDDEKIFPESFPEGSTDNLIEFLQTKRYIWDQKSCSQNIKIMNKNRPDTAQRQISKKTTDAVRGAIGFRDGIHVFEFNFNDKPWGSHCSIGVCSESVPMHTPGYCYMLGNSPHGWVWDIPSESLYHDGEDRGKFPEDSTGEVPRTFRMTVGREQGMLAFNLGQGNEIVFKDLPDSSVVLYPVVCMVYGLADVTITVISSDLLDKYMWLPRAAARARRKKRKTTFGTSLVKEDTGGSTGFKIHDLQKKGSHNDPIPGRIAADGTIPDVENEIAISIRAKLKEDPVGYDSYRRDPGRRRIRSERHKRGSGDDRGPGYSRGHGDDSEDRIIREGGVPGGDRVPGYILPEEESSEDEDKGFDQESRRVDSLEEEDQLLFHAAHGWDNTNKGSLLQLYPNVPHVVVPMPTITNRIQGIRSRRGFTGRSIHTWTIKELIIYSQLVTPDHMALTRNNVIIGVATSEQRKYNFGYSIGELGEEIWGLEYPNLRVWHGKKCYTPKPSAKKPEQVDLENLEVELSEGLEMTLNTVTHKLTYAYNGLVLAEIKHVKGEKLYPYIMYVKEAYYPLELNYVEGPKDYFDEILSEMHEAETNRLDDVKNVRMLMKRSSSLRENPESAILKEKYTWGCHSEDVQILNKNTVCNNPGVAVAAYPLGGGSRHKITIHVDGTTKGFSIGFVHYGYPLQPVIQDSLGYLGNDLLSWCWDIDNRELLHACRVISKYPVDQTFDQKQVVAYTMTLDFTPQGNNTASFTAHLDTKDKQTRELGIAFISLPPQVLPAVVIKGTNQKLRMEYTAGPWRGASVRPSPTRSPTRHTHLHADATSSTCTIM